MSRSETAVIPLLPIPSGSVSPDRCPVTTVAEATTSLRPGLPVGPASQWYGTGPLWVDLVDVRSVRDHRVADGGFLYKVPWKAFVDGGLDVTVRRLDEEGKGVGRAALATGNGYTFFAGDVYVPSPGCWLVTGTIERVSLSFVFMPK
jgi:hypothetical protein